MPLNIKIHARAIYAWLKAHKKTSIVLAALAGLVLFRLAGLLAASPEEGGPPGGKPPVYVKLGQATFGPMRELGFYYGSLTAANQFSVAPKVGGELKKLLVDIGDQVTNGQTVALLDDEGFILARDQAESAVNLAESQAAEARANLDLAESDMARQRNLGDKRIVSQFDLEQVENRLRQAQARLGVAQSQLKTAGSLLEDAALRLSYTKVTVNWEGNGRRYVGRRLVNEGDLVTANAPLLAVVSLDPLLVELDVIEKDYPKIKVGQDVKLKTEAWPGASFDGRVIRVAPVLSAETRQARVELEVKNPDLRLKPGMFTEAVFVFAERPAVWSVPRDVPFRSQDDYVIFVADPAKQTVRKERVKLGLAEDGRVELVGLDKIDGPVVFMGQHLLDDGQSYKLPASNENKPGGPGDKKREPAA